MNENPKEMVSEEFAIDSTDQLEEPEMVAPLMVSRGAYSFLLVVFDPRVLSPFSSKIPSR